MNVSKRLLRRPAATAVWLAVLLLAALILGVAASLYASTLGIPAALDARSMTIAVQNAKMEEISPGSFSFDPDRVLLYDDDIDYLLSLPQVSAVDLRRFSGAYAEALTARIGLSDFFGNYSDILDVNNSYKNVLLIGTVEKIWFSPYDSTAVYDLSAVGRGGEVGEKYCCALMNVDEVISMHPDYPLFPLSPTDELYTGKVRLRFSVFNEQDGSFFKPGMRYAVCGQYDPMVCSKDSDPNPPRVPFCPYVECSHPSGTQFSCFAEGDELVCYKSEYEFSTASFEGPFVMKLFTLENRTPVVKEWAGSAAELLQDPYWGELADKLEMNLHAFPVIGTDCLESMYGFLTNRVKLVEGRFFTAEEYANGSRVLILDEGIAHAAGLSVGSKVTIRQFAAAVGDEQGNPSVRMDYYNIGETTNNPGLGTEPFFVEMPREGEEFTIVGLYRQENEWENSLCSFTPNTLFMPRGAQIEDAVGGPSVLLGYEEKTTTGFQYDENGDLVESTPFTYTEPIIEPGGVNGIFMSVILKNGRIDEFLQRLEEDSEFNEFDDGSGGKNRFYTKGLGGHTFLCFDQGFDAAKESMNAAVSHAGRLALLMAAGAALLFAMYMLIRQSSERRNLGIMRSLGAGPRKARNYLFISGLIVAVAGFIFGTLAAYLLSGTVTEKLAGAALGTENGLFREMLGESTAPGWVYFALPAAEIALAAAALFAQASALSKKSIRKLMTN